MTDDDNKKLEEPDSVTSENGRSGGVINEETMDFDKEIESLDEFLMESEGEEDIILEDEDGDEVPLTASSFDKNSGGGSMAKYALYTVFVLILCGAVYGGIVYLPRYLQNPDLAALQEAMDNRTADIMGAEPIVIDATGGDDPQMETESLQENAAAEQIPSPPSIDDMTGNESDPLPVAMDEVGEIPVDDMAVIDIENGDVGLEVMQDAQAVDDITADVQAEPAETIADALAMAQNAMDNSVDESVDIDVEEAITDQVVIESENDMDPGIERTQAMAMDAMTPEDVVMDNDVNLPALEEETIEIANDVMQLSADEIEEIVETSTIAEAIPEDTTAVIEAVVDQVEPVEQVDDTVAESMSDVEEFIIDLAEEETIETPAPSIEEKTMEVEDVEVVKPAPIAPIMPAKEKPEDPRIASARNLLDSGRYNEAAVIYNAILMDDPANTNALTGQQLVAAKMRTTGSVEAVTAQTIISERPLDTLQPMDRVSIPPVMSEERTIYGTPEALRLREKLRRSQAGDVSPVTDVIPTSQFNSTPSTSSPSSIGIEKIEAVDSLDDGQIRKEDIVFFKTAPGDQTMEEIAIPVVIEAMPQQAPPVPVVEVVSSTAPQPMSMVNDPIAFEPYVSPVGTPNTYTTDLEDALQSQPVPMSATSPLMLEDLPLEVIESITSTVTPTAAAVSNDLGMMINEAEGNPSNTALAVAIGDQFSKRGEMTLARDWYRKALQRDSAFNTGLDRMAIYDRLAGVR